MLVHRLLLQEHVQAALVLGQRVTGHSETHSRYRQDPMWTHSNINSKVLLESDKCSVPGIHPASPLVPSHLTR